MSRPSLNVQPLTIEWNNRDFSGDGEVILERSTVFLRKLLPAYKRSGKAPMRPTTAGLFREIQAHLCRELNAKLRLVEPGLQTLREQQPAREKVREVAEARLGELVPVVDAQLQRFVQSDESPDWEPTQALPLPDLQMVIDERVDRGIYQVQSHRVTSVAPPIPPPSQRRMNLRPTTMQLRSRASQDLSAGPMDVDTPGTAMPESRGSSGDHGGSGEANPDGEGQNSGADSPESPPEGGEQQRPPRRRERGGRATGGPGDPGDSDDSDSDWEPDPDTHPRRWRAWLRRTTELKAYRTLEARLGAQSAPRTEESFPDTKSPDVEVYKGEPEDLNRFLLQAENKFVMEPKRFRTDLLKIRYAGQRMQGKAHKWYESYHLQISYKDAFRVKGLRELDPRFATWERFEASLRSLFGERITRDQAVREWVQLKYADSTDDFVDEINRLMWLTDYEGAIVEDKIKSGLTGELRREWAKLTTKPHSVAEQLRVLRDMGLALEDLDKKDACKSFPYT